MNNSSNVHPIEAQELIELLREHGFQPLLDALQEPGAFKLNGKVNVQGVARILHVNNEAVRRMLQQCRELIDDG